MFRQDKRAFSRRISDKMWALKSFIQNDPLLVTRAEVVSALIKACQKCVSSFILLIIDSFLFFFFQAEDCIDAFSKEEWTKGVGDFTDKNGKFSAYVSRLNVISQIQQDREFKGSLKKIMARVQRVGDDYYRLEYALEEMIVELASIVHDVLPEY